MTSRSLDYFRCVSKDDNDILIGNYIANNMKECKLRSSLLSKDENLFKQTLNKILTNIECIEGLMIDTTYKRIFGTPSNNKIQNLIYNMIMFHTAGNKINYPNLLKLCHTALIANKDTDYDVNFIVPVRGRKENLEFLLKNVIEVVKHDKKYNVLITVMEMDTAMHYEQLCKNMSTNYVFLNTTHTNNKFNKAVAPNIIYKLYDTHNYKYDWLCFHDVDCAIQKNFFVNSFLNLSKNKDSGFLQTYTQKRVLMTEKNFAHSIRTGKININTVTSNSTGVTLPTAGSPGGSLFIRKMLFSKVGGFDPEIFYDYSPEDAFFWQKVACLESQILYADNPANEIIHLWHESARGEPISMNGHFYFMTNINRLFKELSLDLKLKYLKHKSYLLND